MTQYPLLHRSLLTGLLLGLFFLGTAFAASPSPQAQEHLAYMSATEQIKHFTAGTLSPVDVLKAQIQQIKKYNGPLNTTGKVLPNYMDYNGMVNAITYEHFDEAMKAAHESAKRYMAGTARPLEGITVAVKDEHCVKGWRVTFGSADYADAPWCTENNPIISKLREAGAVAHIQTTIPDYFVNLSTFTKLWGVTRNPWNLYHSAGASSGGSGAALAAGFTTLATGTDIGGSIRFPSALGGLYGFKPPLGRVATSEIVYETSGPMARTFDDMLLMQRVITGPDATVQASLRPALSYPQTYEGLKGVKIAVDYFDRWIPGGVNAETRKALVEAVQLLRRQGAEVMEVKLGWTCAETYQGYVDAIMSAGMGDLLAAIGRQKDGTPYTLYAFKAMKVTDHAKAVAAGDALSKKLHSQVQAEVFAKGCTALLMPTTATSYYPATTSLGDPPLNTDPPIKGFEMVLTYPWNLMNRYPVVNVPIGMAKNNVPIGMQVVGNTYDDHGALRVAAAYARGGLHLFTGTLFPGFKNAP